jgi:hypothetical protein
MNPIFADAVESLHPSYERLRAMTPVRNGKLPAEMPGGGVYLFSEGAEHLYVGRSNNLRGRYGRHCLPGATFRMAAFAFRLARIETGRTAPSYKAGAESREGLMDDPYFRSAFVDAKARIRQMDYRFVEETCQTRQALLEIYCSIALGTPHNDFNTH